MNRRARRRIGLGLLGLGLLAGSLGLFACNKVFPYGPDGRSDGRGDGVRGDGTRDGKRPGDLERCPCEAGCGASSACRRLVPANGVPWLPSRTLSAIGDTFDVNTTECIGSSGAGLFLQGTLSKATDGRTICVLPVVELAIETKGVLRARGLHPLVILARDGVRVLGTLDVSAHGDEPGPGGGRGGKSAVNVGVAGEGTGGGRPCGCATTSLSCGGGGGGHGLAGANGGNDHPGTGCGVLAAGGGVFGDKIAPRLAAGSGGASSGTGAPILPAVGGGGGAGGGALQISCRRTITIEGVINAGGGGGLNASNVPHGGGGGGSGGTVVLEGQAFLGKGLVAVGGGAGGSALVGGCSVGEAEDGRPTLAAAKDVGNCAHGGSGGTLTSPAEAGTTKPEGGGGGGGGAGRVYFHWRGSGTNFPLPTSGLASTAEADFQ